MISLYLAVCAVACLVQGTQTQSAQVAETMIARANGISYNRFCTNEAQFTAVD